jgi:hypothetical protein
VEPLVGAERFGLVLSGHYQPPLGRLGALFDAMLGRRIAKGSARNLLRSIVAHMESASTRLGCAQRTTGARRDHLDRIAPGSAPAETIEVSLYEATRSAESASTEITSSIGTESGRVSP